MLKSLRRNPAINAFFRSFLRSFNNMLNGKLEPITRRWRVSGVIPLRYAEIDFKMYAACDDYIVNALYYEQFDWENVEVSLYLQLIKSSSVIFDVGANTGVYSILGSKTVAMTDAHIYSFEPNGINAARFARNLALNNIKNAELVEQALGEKEAVISFSIPVDGRITDVSSADGDFSRKMYNHAIEWKEVSVAQTSIDLFANQRQLKFIDLMKIDVENYEIPVFKGAKKSLMKYKPVILCEVFYSEEKKSFFDPYLSECGYSIYELRRNQLTLLKNGLAPLAHGNNYVFAPFKIKEDHVTFSEFTKLLFAFRVNY